MKLLSDKHPQQPLVFFKTDAQGYIVNESDIKNIKKPWLDVVDDMREVFSSYIGLQLHSVYIYGEFAKGKTIKGPTDFWVIIVTNDEIIIPWLEEYRQYLVGKYPVASKLIFKLETLEKVAYSDSYKFSIKHEYVCIQGNNLANKIEKYRPGPKICFKSVRFEEAVPLWYNYIMANLTDTALIKKASLLICNLMLHAGMEICMEKEKKYTKDIYTCYKVFSKYYPNKESYMRQAFNWVQEPTGDAAELLELMNVLGKWIMAIIKLNKVEGEMRKRDKIS
jgi:hypothetical protein